MDAGRACQPPSILLTWGRGVGRKVDRPNTPQGRAPPAPNRLMVPWFDNEAITEPSISTRSLIKVLRRRYGNEANHGAKHLKLLQEGGPALILPGNRESLSPVVLTNTAHALGFSSARVMWQSWKRVIQCLARPGVGGSLRWRPIGLGSCGDRQLVPYTAAMRYDPRPFPEGPPRI